MQKITLNKAFKTIISTLLMLYFSYSNSLYAFEKNNLTIITKNQTIKYQVEIARTPQEQQIGLMYRKNLPPQTGMIFLFQEERPAQMWMKNTFIPLDIIFFDKSGNITQIHTNAKPHDLTIISSDIPVAGVLEINAEETKKAEIKIGDQLDLSAIK